MPQQVIIARIYAKAAFDFANEHHCIENWQKMLSYIVKIMNNKDMIYLIENIKEKKSLYGHLIYVCKRCIDYNMTNFIKIVSNNKRLQLLPLILKEYIRIRNIFEKKIEVEVITAQALSVNELDDMNLKIKKYLLCDINITCKVDQSLIAGVIIRIGDLVIDGSISSRISRLTEFLRI